MTTLKKKQHWRQIIVAGVAEPLLMGSQNGAYKESLPDDEYEEFCALEVKIAEQIKRRYKPKSL